MAGALIQVRIKNLQIKKLLHTLQERAGDMRQAWGRSPAKSCWIPWCPPQAGGMNGR